MRAEELERVTARAPARPGGTLFIKYAALLEEAGTKKPLSIQMYWILSVNFDAASR